MPAKRLKIFLTHSHKDNDFANRLFMDLKSRGLGGFFDIESLKGGDRIAEEIDRGLTSCDVYIPVLSSASLKSSWCKEELYAALALSHRPDRNGRPKIIPVLIEDCAQDLPAFIISRLQFDFTGGYEQAFKELVERGLELGQSALPDLNFEKLDLANLFTKAAAAASPKTSSSPATPPFDFSKFLDGFAKSTKAAQPASNPVSTVPVVTADHNVTRNSELGMVIHVAFDITGFKGHSGRAVVYFFSESGEALTDIDGLYCTNDKKVSAGLDFSPGYDPCTYSNLEIFMPYSQIHASAGKHTFKCYVAIWDMEGNKTLAQSDWLSFTYNRPETLVDKVWIVHDATEDEKKGMTIHIAFAVTGYQDKTCLAAAYFYTQDGKALVDTDKSYASQDGTVSTSKTFKPAHFDTIFWNFSLFIPYSQLHLPTGKADLKLVVILWDDTQTKKLAKSAWMDFSCQV